MSAQYTRELSINDPELPFIAASAALELDDVIKGRSTSLQHFNELSAVLKTALSATDDAPRALASVDPVTSTVFQRALRASDQSRGLTTESLAQKVLDITLELQLRPGGQPDLELMKRFCVELSRTALSSRDATQRSRSEHPYQK